MMKLDQFILEKVTSITWQETNQVQVHRILSGCIAMYQRTGITRYKEVVTDYVNRNTDWMKTEGITMGKALCFLYEETKEEKYLDKLSLLVEEFINSKSKDEVTFDGGPYSSYEVDEFLPAFAWYETNYNKKQHYHDIMAQLEYFHNQGFQSDSFLMTLADMLFVMSEEIYEFHAKIRDWLKEGVHRSIDQGNEVGIEIVYAILRGCQSKALLPEKYEEYGKEMVKAKERSFLYKENVNVDLGELGIFMRAYAYL